MYKIKPFKIDNIHVWIKCPYCSKIHIHGSCGGEDYRGHRFAHCGTDCKVDSSKGYEII